jgi:hypothetical protein
MWFLRKIIISKPCEQLYEANRKLGNGHVPTRNEIVTKVKSKTKQKQNKQTQTHTKK